MKTLCELCPLKGGWTLKRWLMDAATAGAAMIGLCAMVAQLFDTGGYAQTWFGAAAGMSFQTGLCVTLLGVVQLVNSAVIQKHYEAK